MAAMDDIPQFAIKTRREGSIVCIEFETFECWFGVGFSGTTVGPYASREKLLLALAADRDKVHADDLFRQKLADKIWRARAEAAREHHEGDLSIWKLTFGDLHCYCLVGPRGVVDDATFAELDQAADAMAEMRSHSMPRP